MEKVRFYCISSIQKKLIHIIEDRYIPSVKLSGAIDLYKIKLRQAGYRLVYSVNDQVVTVTVIAVGKRDKSSVYKDAMTRVD